MLDYVCTEIVPRLIGAGLAFLIAWCLFALVAWHVFRYVGKDLDEFRWTKYSPNWRTLCLVLTLALLYEVLW